ncbi:NUDIX hydrolase [Kribbella solani]|uniref:8-oxo-dGTP pyrophosphatase MutT (NUDIX family) n=1 Tax=Kribbella solani TaxID=236067 RepID=A0A841DZT6_9ACTN|nr:8-oxo-dGTP pyrophosphatase MutT (NUDIX family) [Kribbella solani]
MLLEDAVGVLRGWRAPDGEQEGLRVHYLRHLAEHSDGMWRSCRPEHLTASALVVDGSGTRTLLTLHKTVGRWLQLGGHCEPGDRTLAGAALREATEESGLSDLTVSPQPLQLSRHLLEGGGCAGAYHLDVQFLITATADTEHTISDESDDLAWFPFSALPGDLDASVKQLTTRARLALSHPKP